MSASTIVAGEIIAALVTSIAEYLKAQGVKAEEVDRLIDEAVARVKKKDPNLLPPV